MRICDEICDEIFDGIACEMSRDSTEPVNLLGGPEVAACQGKSGAIRNQSQPIYLQPHAGWSLLR